MMQTNQTYDDLLDACAQPACPVCRLLQLTTERYIKNLFYESVLDPMVRAPLRDSLGLCHDHAWLTQEAGLSDALGLAIVYHDIVGALVERITEDKLGNSETCPVCRYEEETLERLVEAFVKALPKERFIRALQRSDGLCLPHLRLVAARTKNRATLKTLVGLQREKWASLEAELGEFIRKNDYRFREESFGAERDSYKRAIAIVIGKNRHRQKFENE